MSKNNLDYLKNAPFSVSKQQRNTFIETEAQKQAATDISKKSEKNTTADSNAIPAETLVTKEQVQKQVQLPKHKQATQAPITNNNKNLLEIDIDRDFYTAHNVIMIDINIENVPVKMIIDTGSTFDILSEEFFVNNKIDKQIKSCTKLLTLSGEQIVPNVEVEVEIGKLFKKMVEACVSKVTFDKSCGISGIIGLETLIRLNAVIDLDKFKLVLNS